MKVALLVLSLLVLQLSAQSFDAVFAISWPAGHCEYLASRSRSCDPKISSQWDGRSFTIHGFWPQVISRKFYGKFNPSTVKSVRQIQQFWPPRAESLKGPETFKDRFFLWIHEWEKHGKDFANQVEVILGTKSLPKSTKAKNFALQTKYFQDTINLFKTIRATGLSRNPSTKQELSQLLGISERSFSTRCLPSGNLQELQICVKASKSGSSLTYRVVNCTRMRSNCPGNTVRLNQFR